VRSRRSIRHRSGEGWSMRERERERGGGQRGQRSVEIRLFKAHAERRSGQRGAPAGPGQRGPERRWVGPPRGRKVLCSLGSSSGPCLLCPRAAAGQHPGPLAGDAQTFCGADPRLGTRCKSPPGTQGWEGTAVILSLLETSSRSFGVGAFPELGVGPGEVSEIFMFFHG
jgi:hypothetical protein